MKLAKRWNVLLLAICLTFSNGACSLLGTDVDDGDDTNMLALLGLAVLSSLDTCYGSYTSLSSSLPSWITSNFSCVTAYTSAEGGTEYYVFETDNLPPHNSPYWGTTSPYWEAMPSGGDQQISEFYSQSYTFKIPVTPTAAGSPLAAPGVAAGIAKNGVVFFFGQASPGNSLSSEVATFDSAQGHPDGGFRRYHYHAEPKYIADYETGFLGVLIDGYPIYGTNEADGTTPSTTVATGSTGQYPALEANTYGHTHATTEFPDGVFHYHITNWDGAVGIPSLPVYLHGQFSIANTTF